ncbi:MAG: hypothetical protein P1U65_07530 [Minwuia sp.]|nr:hypothetical protein [Minwuia sp.]
MAGMTLQAAIVRHLAQQPFVWGKADCCLAVCDVLVAIGLPDAAAIFRDQYSDAAGAADILARGGGMLATVGRSFATLGWPEIESAAARAGDVGVIKVPTLALAVFDGDRWCVKTQRGVMRHRAATTAWSTGYLA